MAGKISVIMAPQLLWLPETSRDDFRGKRRFGASKRRSKTKNKAVEIENVPCSRGCHIEVIQGNVDRETP